MEQTLQKYVGGIIEIIYHGRDGSITQRRLEVRSIAAGVVRAYCLQREAPRVFRVDNILAVQLVDYRGKRTS